MSFNFTGLQNKERGGKGQRTPRGKKNRNKPGLNTEIADCRSCEWTPPCDVPDYGVLAATSRMEIAIVSDGLKRGINLFRD